MKRNFFSVICIVFFSFFFPSLLKATSETKKISISEIVSEGTKANDEYIRLQNETNETIDLTHYKLTKKILSSGLCKESSLVSTSHFVGTIAPHSFFLIAHPSYKSTLNADLDYSSASYYLSNNTVVLLYDSSETLLDRKSIGLACDETSPPSDPVLPPSYVLVKNTDNVRINEILANPSGEESDNEFIELFNNSPEKADISSFIIKDNSASGKYVFPSNTIIQPQSFLILYRKTFSFALNNTNETISLLDPEGRMKDSVSYKTAYEDISYNYVSSSWYGGTPTPGAFNQVDALPNTKQEIPKSGYTHSEIFFDAYGSNTNNTSMKYVWDFGDGHKSYKEKTHHTYEQKGTYLVTLKVTDGKNETTTPSSLTIEPFPRKNVRIIALLPNPHGKDSDGEQIIIRNNEKKKINLKGYSIAIGSKKIINHFIYEDFFIKAKDTAKITHNEASFTLPNQKAKIELRTPDGKTIQKIRYKQDQSIAEDVWYVKEKNKRWEWRFPEKQQEKMKEKTPNETSTPPSPSQPKEEKEISVFSQDNAEEKAKIILLRNDTLERTSEHLSPQIITEYGSNVHIPQYITITLHSEIATFQEETSQKHTSFDSFFVLINSTLNHLINTWK